MSMKWSTLLEGAELLQGMPFFPELPDALAAYRHFRGGTGTRRRVCFERFVQHDPSGRLVMRQLFFDVRWELERLAERYGDAFSFRSRSVVHVGEDDLYHQPATENWQKTLGKFYLWVDGHLRRRGASGFEAAVRIHVEDRYDFNPKEEDIAWGIPDEENGMLSLSGLGTPFMHHDLVYRTYRWKLDDPFDHPPGPFRPHVRYRAPSDNRRLRNQL